MEVVTKSCKQLWVHKPFSESQIIRTLEPVKVIWSVEVVDESLVDAWLELFEVVARGQKIEELVKNFEENVSHFDREKFVGLNQVVLVHLVESRVELGAFEIFERRQRSQYSLLILKLGERQIVGITTINVADGDVSFSQSLEVLKVLHQMWAGKHYWKGRLYHAYSGGACWLYVWVLECQGEDELEKRLCDVEL